MSTTKQAKKQTKQEKKARKEAARAAARRAEARRNRVTMAVIAAIVVAGGAVAAATVVEERRERAAAEAELEELMAEQEAEEQAIEDRPVACGASEPEAAGDDKPTYDEAPERVIEDGVDYRAVIETSCGEVVLDLREDMAPETVNAFVFLAEDGFYDGLEVYRINEAAEILETGSGTNDGGWDVGFTVPDEFDLAVEEGYPAGSVVLANQGNPGTGGSQFFFVYGDGLDDQLSESPIYTRFADVDSGLDVLADIAELGAVGETVGAEVPAEVVYMESVRIERD